MSDGQPPVHFGGPLGLAGLAMLAGATGLFVMAGSGGPTPASQSAPQPAVAQASAPGKVKPVPDLHPGDALPVVRPAELPASAETKQPAETKLAQLSPDGSEIVYIVRIKGEPEIDTSKCEEGEATNLMTTSGQRLTIQKIELPEVKGERKYDPVKAEKVRALRILRTLR